MSRINRSGSRLAWLCLLLVGLLLPPGSPALAQPNVPDDPDEAVEAEEGGAKPRTPSRQEREEQRKFDDQIARGLQHYQSGQFANAIIEFRQAFLLRPEPNLLYNLARCYHQLGQHDQAISNYKQFLGAEGAATADRARAVRYLQELQDKKAATDQDRRDRALQSGEPSAKGGAQPPQTTDPPGVGAGHLLGWTLVGLGVAGLTTGAVFGSLALVEQGRFEDATGYTEQKVRREVVKRDALVADIGLGAGAALAVAGTLVLLLGDGGGGSGGEVGWFAAPLLGAQRWGLTCGATF